MTFMPKAGEIELGFTQAVTAFLNNWANVMQDAQAQLGDLFEGNLYPSMEQLKGEFNLEFLYDQVNENNWLVKTEAEALTELEAKTQSRTAKRFEMLARVPVENLHETITYLITVLDKPMREKRDEHGGIVDTKLPIFRDSTIDNIVDECKKIQAFGADIVGEDAVNLAGRVLHNVPSADVIRKQTSWDVLKDQTKVLLAEVQSVLDGGAGTAYPNPVGLPVRRTVGEVYLPQVTAEVSAPSAVVEAEAAVNAAFSPFEQNGMPNPADDGEAGVSKCNKCGTAIEDMGTWGMCVTCADKEDDGLPNPAEFAGGPSPITTPEELEVAAPGPISEAMTKSLADMFGD
jgi:hypothetical protein